MITNKTISISPLAFTLSKIKDYAAFSKAKLASLVVFSAFTGYMVAAETVHFGQLFFLLLGGFLVTASSNGYNQIIERDLDLLMDRTKNRPLPAGKMSVVEALILATVMGIVGLFVLWYFINPLSCFLSFLALFIYTVFYTPLKRKTPFSVFVGAIPGAIPPMLGWIAVTGSFGLAPGILFMVQFLWQFPHFWAIAWKLDEDYKRGGFYLLPSGGKSKSTAFLILIYTIFMIPGGMLPYFFHLSGIISAIIATAAGLWFLYKAIRLYNFLGDKDATSLMFASFIYLPVVQIIYFLDKV